MSSAFEGFDSRRLWSLADMLEFKAKPVFGAYHALTHISAVVPELAKTIEGQEDEIIGPKHHGVQVAHLEEFVKCCETLSLPTTAVLANRMLGSLKNSTAKYISYASQATELLSRFGDELSTE